MGCRKSTQIGPVTREAFDTEVMRIAQEKLHSHRCDPASLYLIDDLTRFVIRVEGGEIRIQSRLEFLPTLQLTNSKIET
jgi:hypothetical protein